MPKLLVNAPSGAQELIEVGQGGGYFDPARVLWDERTDGPLPVVTLGAMVRADGRLVVDEELMAVVRARAQEAAALEVQSDTVTAIQNLLDSTAKANGYDHIVSAISYVGSSIPLWHAEGTRAKAWRDECWWAAYQIQEAVKANTRPLPTVAEVLAQMPAANWPVAA